MGVCCLGGRILGARENVKKFCKKNSIRGRGFCKGVIILVPGNESGQNFLYNCPKISIKMVKNFY